MKSEVLYPHIDPCLKKHFLLTHTYTKGFCLSKLHTYAHFPVLWQINFPSFMSPIFSLSLSLSIILWGWGGAGLHHLEVSESYCLICYMIKWLFLREHKVSLTKSKPKKTWATTKTKLLKWRTLWNHHTCELIYTFSLSLSFLRWYQSHWCVIWLHGVRVYSLLNLWHLWIKIN